MSEYTYYEFQTITRTLTEDDYNALRNISSRAEITATKFSNFYTFGSLKAEPYHLLERYFEVYYHYADYGVREFYLKFPTRLLDIFRIKEYFLHPEKVILKSGENTILYFAVDFEWEDESPWGDDPNNKKSWLDKLIPIYKEILEGDYRCLYLYWLYSIFNEDTGNYPESSICLGLTQLTNAQKEFCSFLQLDRDLLDVASENSEPIESTAVNEKGFQDWIFNLDEEEKNKALTEIVIKENLTYRFELIKKYKESVSHIRKDNKDFVPNRTSKKLLELSEERKVIRLKKEAEEKEKERIENELRSKKQRVEYLDRFASRKEETWVMIEELLLKRSLKAYKEAEAFVIDLRDLSLKENKKDEFLKRITDLSNRHAQKTTWIQIVKKINASF